MTKSKQNWSDISSSISLQTKAGVLEMVFGLGMLLFSAIKIFALPSLGYNIAPLFVLLPFYYMLNYTCVLPRVKNNISQFPPNPAETSIVILFTSLAIIGGLIIFWLAIKGTELNLWQLFWGATLFCGIGVISVSLANGIGRLILYGQIIILLSILFISKEVTTSILLCLVAGIGVFLYFTGLINFRRFVAKYPLK